MISSETDHLSDDDWLERYEAVLDDRDKIKAEREELRAVIGNFATRALHMPLVEGDGEDGITVHAWAPGHPMGCAVCAAFDAVLS